MSITPVGGWDGQNHTYSRTYEEIPDSPRKRFLVIFFSMGALLLCGALIFIFGPALTEASPSLVTLVKPGFVPAQQRSANKRIYTVSQIDTRKNEIPTGTELYVKGTLYGESWTQVDECTWLLAGRPLNLQHGEIDPRQYCRFSISLSDMSENGQALWPGVSLVCDTTPKEMHRIAKEFSYGTRVEVHGVYARSLDFNIVPFPGDRFGVPVLQACTVIDQ